MASQKTKLAVGLFVASGIGITALAIIWLGMSRFLEKGQYYVTYFDESVQGLNTDSPVKYRGVSIGRVDRISVAPDSKLIQVVLKIESGQTLDSSIVAQLKSVGITGIMFVELDWKKEGASDRSPPVSFPSEYPILASKPSEISELLRGLDDVLNQLRFIDLKGISDKIKLTTDKIGHMVDDANIKAISTNIGSSLKSVERILDDQRWNKFMASIEKAGNSFDSLMNEKMIKTAMENFKQAVENANKLLAQGASLVSKTDDTHSRLKHHLLVIARNLEKASENLNHLTDLLADQPSQLMFGQPPPPRKVE
ncbi:MAG: MCE family protein [Desulfobacterales bacterium]|nr:MCE family protein [Desulfobacterales bacterium]